MTKVVDLHHYRTKVVEQRAFGPWRKRFGEAYDSETRLSDLSDKTLYYIAQPGEGSAVAFYELIMGILDLGKAPKFAYLDKPDQMAVVDIHLFLADQARFELMRRLQWLADLPCDKYSLIEMVQSFETVKVECKGHFPDLSKSHPGFQAYNQLTARDRESFIRRLLPEALEQFKIRLETADKS